jgi:ring-1,2-phenylacetyl-CoA epoxidase subunit PaaD
MVVDRNTTETARLFDILSSVVDPEIPVLTLQDLGVLRDISVDGSEVTVTITPTYAGCPAMETMRADIESTLATAGYKQVVVQQKLSPAWTTDWMSQSGREKLRAYGIAPPVSTTCGQSMGQIECPQCNSAEVKRISEFGSTACKALYQCQDCREPFDYFKCI